MNKKISLVATKNYSRLDKFLTENLKTEFGFSRAMVQKMVADGQVLVNNEPTTSQKLPIVAGDEVLVTIAEVKPTTMKKEAMDLDILYQDQDLLVVNKANNLVVHPGAGNTDGTLVNGLLAEISDLSGIGGVERPGIVHRLDKQTTGLLIVAKNDQTHQKLSKMLADHQIHKEYLALVWGVIAEDGGVIEAPIGRHENDRKKMSVTHKNSKNAKTHFQVLERFKNATLISCVIETGRTHQIRVHFNFIHHPVINDPVYGKRQEKTTSYGQYLHAHKLIFNHPTTNKRMELVAPIPQEFNDKIISLREEK